MSHQPSAPLEAQVPPYVVPVGDSINAIGAFGREWLLTNGNGGFAMGTALGVNKRKYHALLIGSQRPPAERVALLNALDEEVTVGVGAGAKAFWLATHRWSDAPAPGYDPVVASRLARFEKDATTARWVYTLGGLEVVKELRLGWKRNACAVRYTVRPAPGNSARAACRFRVLPMVTLRDFHATLEDLDEGRYQVTALKRTIRVVSGPLTLEMTCDHGSVTQEVTTRRGVRYDIETDRQQDDIEDLFNPGFFEVVFDAGTGEANFTIAAALAPEAPDTALFDRDERRAHLEKVTAAFLKANPSSAALAPLVSAADDFLVTRRVGGQPLMTVIAGYPWFGDWGRDTMISLVGLMLVCGRSQDALGCLRTFAAHVDKGMIPNRFDDYNGPPEYNTIDASLWFLHACDRYVRANGDTKGFRDHLRHACLEIIEHYTRGTRDGIRVDPADGLVTGGDATTQLTWMDAKRDGVVFTPRHGKCVEINALWFHGLKCLSALIRSDSPEKAAELDAAAEKARASFLAKFWNAAEGRPWDCLQPGADGVEKPVPEVRPNMLFAVSLEHSMLSPEQQKSVVAWAERELLTPLGLRTLSPKDPKYRARFEGDMMTRDGAYHNGTVWPWLIGPYAEAALRAEGFSENAKAKVRDALRPLLSMLNGDSVGQLFEVYDADADAKGRRTPGGCMAQAWSVAELLRVGVLAG
ncbi:MAG: glycogen debranching enzyme family protein [Planctomycetes bacterium]|nr:glycogen debranching enzyme family protein [Planctomycetota bacterium]